jgi:hypothetical protein
VNAATTTDHQAKTPSLAVSLPASTAALALPQSGQIAASRRYLRKIAGLLEDAVLLMIALCLVPVMILLVGAPIALCIRAIIKIVVTLTRGF